MVYNKKTKQIISWVRKSAKLFSKYKEGVDYKETNCITIINPVMQKTLDKYFKDRYEKYR